MSKHTSVRPAPRWLLVSALTLGACSSSLPTPEAAPQPEDAFVEVPFPPPPARVEVVPPSPRAGAVWIDGEWGWKGRRWGWAYGRWVLLPAGARFAPWTTMRRPDGTLLHAPGSLRDARGAELEAPPVLARGRARAGEVVGPDGLSEKTAPNTRPERRP